MGAETGSSTTASAIIEFLRNCSNVGFRSGARTWPRGAGIDVHFLSATACSLPLRRGFRLLYGLLILRLSRRKLLWLGVTAHPNAEWISRQLTKACDWTKHHDISFVIETVHTAKPSPGALRQWAYGTDRALHRRLGKIDTRRGCWFDPARLP